MEDLNLYHWWILELWNSPVSEWGFFPRIWYSGHFFPRQAFSRHY